MLQTVLVERLGLKYHFEERQTTIYALVRGSGPLKLAPTTEPLPARKYVDAYKYKQVSDMDRFAQYLTYRLEREVVDQTGLKGNYAFNMDWSDLAKDGANWLTSATMEPAIYISVVKTIGLKLEPRKVPIKFLVVDHANKEPTPN